MQKRNIIQYANGPMSGSFVKGTFCTAFPKNADKFTEVEAEKIIKRSQAYGIYVCKKEIRDFLHI